MAYVDMYLTTHRIARECLWCGIIHICVRPLHPVARYTNPGNARASSRERGQQDKALTLFLL